MEEKQNRLEGKSDVMGECRHAAKERSSLCHAHAACDSNARQDRETI